MDSNSLLIIVIIVVVLILLFVIIGISNGLKRALIKVDEASSDIEVSLTKRYDVLTKMIEVVKGYAKHEKETLFNVISLRKGMSMEELNEANKKMNEDFSKINVLAENYPDLKASENFNTLQKTIVDVEEHLQASRRLFNSNVSVYNQKISVFPNSIIAGIKGYTKKEFFIADEEKKQDVKIEF